MAPPLPEISVAEQLADRIAALDPAALPAAVRRKCDALLIDVTGLCVTARNEDYVQRALAKTFRPICAPTITAGMPNKTSGTASDIPLSSAVYASQAGPSDGCQCSPTTLSQTSARAVPAAKCSAIALPIARCRTAPAQ